MPILPAVKKLKTREENPCAFQPGGVFLAQDFTYQEVKMKRISYILIVLLALLAFSSCDPTRSEENMAVPATAEEGAKWTADFVNAVSQDKLKEAFLDEDNAAAIAEALGLTDILKNTEGKTDGELGLAIGDQLLKSIGHASVNTALPDGSTITITGNYSEDDDYWISLEVKYTAPEDGTAAFFRDGWSIKRGTVSFWIDEPNFYDPTYYACIVIPGYRIDTENLVVSDGKKSFSLDISALERKFDSVNQIVIDPDSKANPPTVDIVNFVLPSLEDGATSTIKVGGVDVKYEDIVTQLGENPNPPIDPN